MCEEFITVSAWSAAMRISQNRESEEQFPPTSDHFSVTSPAHIHLLLCTAEVLVARVISSPNSAPLARPPLREIQPFLTCLFTEVTAG